MASQHLDKLVRSFLSGGKNTQELDKFADLQDPTFLSFKIDFFPDLGFSFPDDTYSSGGLFRKRIDQAMGDYSFYDSAADYLARIGAPARQAYLEVFINLLYRLQNEAPWYFQGISGLGEFYKIDPAINYRGKDKVITVDCLETIDMRMSLLADLYRNIAFDMQNMREVLPVNLRTFNMAVHVLEFRRFNTTFGIISDQIQGDRPVKGQDRQQAAIDAQRRNVFNRGGSALFTGTFDNLNSIVNNVNNISGGIFNNLNSSSAGDPNLSLQSAFEAISVQTFFLKECEFDFFSESPGYLDNVSVKEIPEASHRFKIKAGKVQKTGYYSFYNYVVSEYAKYSKLNSGEITTALGRTLVQSPAYFEQTGTSAVDNPKEYYRTVRESIFPTDGNPLTAQTDAYAKAADLSDDLRRKPLERLLGGLLRNATQYANTELNQALGQVTGGILGTAPLGNVYGNPNFLKRATESLNDFLTPGSQLTTSGQSNRPPGETLGNIQFQALSLEQTISPPNVGFSAPPTQDQIGDDNVFNGSPSGTPNFSRTNIYQGVPPLPQDEVGSNNVFQGVPPLPGDTTTGNTNIFQGTPPLPLGDIGNSNVYE